MDALKARLTSKTYRLQMAILALGVLELNFHLLTPILGQWYGLAFIAISVAGAVIRELTTKPVDG